MKHATLTITRHAQKRRKQMSVTEAELFLAVDQPDMVYPSDPRYHSKARQCFQRGRIVVVVDTEHNEIVTVLWHRAEGR